MGLGGGRHNKKIIPFSSRSSAARLYGCARQQNESLA
jgi:hypothetical protein